MRQLFYYELKKIFNRRTNLFAMLSGFLLMILVNLFQIQNASLNYDGRELYGVHAILQQQEIENALTPDLTEAFLTNFIKDYQKQIKENPDGYDYTLIGPKSNLFALIGKNYKGFNEIFEWEDLKKIDTENGIAFYDRRSQKIEELLNGEYIYCNYTKAEKDYWMQKATAVTTPFCWGSKETWEIIWNGISMLFFLYLVISICIAPVFASEYQTRMDALLLTSRYGKNKVIIAKILASFAFVLFYNVICSTVSIGVVVCMLGTEGWELPVQLWDSIIPYSWTVLQACAVSLLIFFVISCFLTAFSLLLSAVSRSPVIVLAVDTVFLFGTVFLPSLKSCGLWNKMIALCPLRCVNLASILRSYIDYRFGSLILSQTQMIFLVYTLLTLFCLPWIGKSFRNHQVGNR